MAYIRKPYGRKRRTYRKTKVGGRSRRTSSVKRIARAVVKTAMRRAVETKFMDQVGTNGSLVGGASNPAVGYWALYGISQGDTVNQYQGNQVSLSRFTFKFRLHCTLNALYTGPGSDCWVRLIAIQAKDPGKTNSLGELLEDFTSDASAMVSPLNWRYLHSSGTKVLCDKKYHLPLTSSTYAGIGIGWTNTYKEVMTTVTLRAPNPKIGVDTGTNFNTWLDINNPVGIFIFKYSQDYVNVLIDHQNRSTFTDS